MYNTPNSSSSLLSLHATENHNSWFENVTVLTEWPWDLLKCVAIKAVALLLLSLQLPALSPLILI